jgi:hypothetical protein
MAMRVVMPNVPDHRARANDARLETAARSRDSVHPVCSAFSSPDSGRWLSKEPWIANRLHAFSQETLLVVSLA